jgi:NAD(P)H-flavin reductase
VATEESGGRKSLLGELLQKRYISKAIVRLDFAWAGPAPRMGQFFLVKPKRSGVFLGRPLSAALWEPAPHDNPDNRKRFRGKSREEIRFLSVNSVRFLIARRGRGTEELADMNLGEEAEITGPLGNAWADFLKETPRTKKPIALIGGGIGIAPLNGFASDLRENSFDFYAGFKTRFAGEEERYTLVGEGLFRAREIIIAIEDSKESPKGAYARKGRIPDFLDPAAYSGVYACGPEPMLKAVAAACKAAGVPCFVSLERHMACGVGACLGCTVRTIQGNRRCCTDGPIFRAEELLFE